MKLSIVTTLYNSGPYLREFYQRMGKTTEEITDDYEIILVNDGSPDNSLEIAVELYEKDPKVKVIDLSRNFGHHKAMMTGLANAQGERVFLIDSDLEESPELLNQFWEKLNKEECDVVYGVQQTRKGNFFERWSGNWFYPLLRIFTGLKIPNNIITARLMSRRYVEALLLHKEREIFLAGLWHITGFDQRPAMVHKKNSSVTSYSLKHKISLLVNSVTSFSNTPLNLIFYVGLLISAIASLYVGYLVINRIFLGGVLSGWTSVMASIWLLGGMTISFVGIIGIYLSKIFSETKQRPYTIVKHIYENKELN